MEIKENKDIKDKNSKKIKRQVSIITVFLWVFLVTTMIAIVANNIKNTNALEENIQDPNIESKETKEVEVLPDTNIEAGATIKKGLSNEEGSITKKVGEDGFYLRLPRMARKCIYCKDIFMVYIPKVYCQITSELSDNEIIDNLQYSLGNFVSDDIMYDGVECLKTTFKIKKPGETTVKIKYYINFKIDQEKVTCYNCYRDNVVQYDHSWYEYDDTFKVVATADYNLSYDANTKMEGLEVDNVPSSESVKNHPQDKCNFKVSDQKPHKEGYNFLGWSTYSSGSPQYKAGDDITLEWEEGRTVNKTLYAVWEKEPQPGEYFVEYKWSGLPESAKIEPPEKELYFYNSLVNVDTRSNGDIVEVDGVEYEFSGWSTEDVLISNNKFDMPKKNITLVGEWVKKEDVIIKLKLEKIWMDNENLYKKRPENVILKLYGDDKLIEEIFLNESNNWICEVEVPKYNELGEKIKYTVDENETSKYYEKIIDGYKVINKYIDESNSEVISNVDTGDINIMTYVVIFFISIIGIVYGIILKNNKVNGK